MPVTMASSNREIGEGKTLSNEIAEGKAQKTSLLIQHSGGACAEDFIRNINVKFWVWSSYLDGHLPEQPVAVEKVDGVTPQDPESEPEENEGAEFSDDEEHCSASFTTMGD